MKTNICDYDVFFLSFDEPKKEEYWANLQAIAPWAQRVDGVKGFDNAHKKCAELSSTDRFITVDGDNLVDESFFQLDIEIPANLADCTLSWAAQNSINGLRYGNGGLKLWTKDFVNGMRTHENASTDAEKLDFCWNNKYIQLNNCYSTTNPNGSPFQAFRAGFREGIKMTLDRGEKVKPGKMSTQIHDINYKRLLIWASVGADVENGKWAILGTRMGIYHANIASDFDVSLISDYEWFKEFFFAQVAPNFLTDEAIDDKIVSYQRELKLALGIEIAYLTPDASLFFKSVYEPPKRTNNPLMTEIDYNNGK